LLPDQQVEGDTRVCNKVAFRSGMYESLARACLLLVQESVVFKNSNRHPLFPILRLIEGGFPRCLSGVEGFGSTNLFKSLAPFN
jgi:hypothetical protein